MLGGGDMVIARAVRCGHFWALTQKVPENCHSWEVCALPKLANHLFSKLYILRFFKYFS